ncbi:cytochrome P450 [Umezawaea sp. Da 62-37]|uniref:cytochrome P450 n=1 Tax=Umezawaea sp. Da 62-37 TaxID=3075927 RepID=UPI0028F7475B|nr:cytochrome P450 [Umezawaea sp. Da 62-37]WNV84571.1 cytochrome P450 [Umezawaea sp. Da 62-37]
MTATDPRAADRRTPPGPPVRRTPSLLVQLIRDRLSLVTSAADEYGDAVRIAIGPKTLYLFNHPDHAKHVLADNADNYTKGIGLMQAKRVLGDGLLTSDGDLWRAQRRVIAPVFQTKRLASQAEVVADEAGALVARLRAHIGHGPVNILHELTDLTIRVLSRTLLDADLGGFPTLGRSFEAVQDQAMFEMVSLNMIPSWVPLPKQVRFKRARKDLQGAVDWLVRHRDANPTDGDDVLARLIESTRGEADPAVGRRRMRDELITLLLAGHETTASTLGWSFHLAGRHPEVWERLHREAVEVLGDGPPRYEDLHRLTYTAAVLQESVRLYPPVWILTRIARADDVIGGYHVPAGSDVLICPYTLHRHPDYWPRPEVFDPDRFDRDRSAARPRYSYIPFGAGPRFCVGNNLGLLEATFVLAMVARDLRLVQEPGHKVAAEPMLSLRLRGGLPVTVHAAR